MRLLSKYEAFILDNVSQVNAIESALRSLTYILPGRFSDAELASEALFSLLNLVGLYHDTILTKTSHQLSSDGTRASIFNRYTRTLIDSSALYKKCAYLLSFLEYSEVLLEMLALKSRGIRGKDNMVVLVELIKMLLRLSLFKLSNSKTLLSPPHPEREQTLKDGAQESQLKVKNIWQGKRTGFFHPNIGSLKKAGTTVLDYKPYIFSKVLDRDTACKAENLVIKLYGLGSLAEILYILRPLLYVLAIRKFGRKSWTPWIFSVALDLLSLHLKGQYFEENNLISKLSSLEIHERKRRVILLSYYLLKGPFFKLITKPALLEFYCKTKKKFLLGVLSRMLVDYIPLWEKFHFYTSSS